MRSSKLSADDARLISERSKNKHVEKFAKLIEKAAREGSRGVLLCYADCSADEHAALSVLKRRGFLIVCRRENIGGTMQYPAYYAEW